MKERIIGCTLELLGQIGFRRFTMDMVASELRISKRTLYLYFTSKEQLLDTCLERWLLRKRLLVPTGGILIDDLCTLYAGIRKVDLRRVMHCSRELRQCCLPVYRLFQERLFNYADACGMRAEQDAGDGLSLPRRYAGYGQLRRVGFPDPAFRQRGGASAAAGQPFLARDPYCLHARSLHDQGACLP